MGMVPAGAFHIIIYMGLPLGCKQQAMMPLRHGAANGFGLKGFGGYRFQPFSLSMAS